MAKTNAKGGREGNGLLGEKAGNGLLGEKIGNGLVKIIEQMMADKAGNGLFAHLPPFGKGEVWIRFKKFEHIPSKRNGTQYRIMSMRGEWVELREYVSGRTGWVNIPEMGGIWVLDTEVKIDGGEAKKAIKRKR